MADTLFGECLLFVQEQSCGEWSQDVEVAEAHKLAAFVEGKIAAACRVPTPDLVEALRELLKLVNRNDVASWLACNHPAEFANMADAVGNAQDVLSKALGEGGAA